MMHTQLFSSNAMRSIAIICLLSVMLTACGFKLRGAIVLPDGLQSIYVAGPNRSKLVSDLKEILEYIESGASDRADAEVVLRVDNESDGHRTLSVDSRGKARESELEYSVTYSLIRAGGEVLLDKEPLLLVRTLITNGEEVIGRVNEAAIIRREMRGDAARQILRRVQALKVSPASE